MNPSVIPSGVEPIPQSLLDKLLKAMKATPAPNVIKSRPSPHSNPHVKPEARLPPVDSVAVARADGMTALYK
jgi:hypothetical protein